MASVLKPVDDTRMFEKIGKTLADTGKFDITIIGYPVSTQSSTPIIECIMLPACNRLSWRRFISPWIIFKKINEVKPELIVINTPELLLVAILNKIFFGRKIVYDVLENYYRNIRFTPSFPALIRLPLAAIVRAIEWIASPLIDYFWLAELGYKKELGFAQPHTVLQNKLPKLIAERYPIKAKGSTRLLFTGTLAPSTGVFEAIELVQKLNQIDPSCSLKIIGYCAIPKILTKLKNEISKSPFITLFGGDKLVPHEQILNEISEADWGVILYPSNPGTQSSIPTKLYEYLALKLPILIRHNAESHQLVEQSNAGIVLSKSIDYGLLSEKMKSNLISPTPPDTVFWESQAEGLMNSLKLLKLYP